MEKDWFRKLKEDIALLDFQTTSHNNDLIQLLYNYAWGFDEVNLSESYNQIINIGLSNNDTLTSIISFINDIETRKILFSKEELIDMIEMLKINYSLQDDYFINIINYILVYERIITGVDEIEEVIGAYKDSYENSYDIVKVNNKRIKRMIKNERGDNRE